MVGNNEFSKKRELLYDNGYRPLDRPIKILCQEYDFRCFISPINVGWQAALLDKKRCSKISETQQSNGPYKLIGIS
jgi:hypothetical protein